MTLNSFRTAERKYELRQFISRCRRYGIILLCAVLSYLSLLIWQGPVGRGLDQWILQQNFLVRGVARPSGQVLLVAIDEAIQEKFGRPLPRRIIADGLEKLAQSNPKLAVLDVSIPPDPADSESDGRVAAALQKMPSVIGAGTINTTKGKDSFLTTPSDEPFRRAAKLELAMLLTATAGVVSTISSSFDPDAPLNIRAPLAGPLIAFGNYRILPPGPYDLINFYGPPGTLERLTWEDVLQMDASGLLSKIKDRVVFIGFQSVGARPTDKLNNEEFKISASAIPMYGVEIHATIASNLIDGTWIRRLGFQIEALIIYLASFLIAGILFFVQPRRAYIALGLLLLSAIILQQFLFSQFRIWVPGLWTVCLFAIVSIVATGVYREVYFERISGYINKRLGL